jgi:ornithine cyclodeaminase
MKNNENTILYLSEKDVIKCGGDDLDFYIKTIEDVFRVHNNKDFKQPSGAYLRRGDVTSEKTTGRIIALPGYIGGKYRVWGIKWIASNPRNPQKFGLPRANGTIILNDLETGLPVCMLNGTLISVMRTAAVTAVAEKYLAKKDSETIGICGAGVINKMQVTTTLKILKNIKQLKIFDINEKNAKTLADYFSREHKLKCTVCKTAKEAVSGSDIIITATTAASGDEYIEAEWIKPGSFFSNVSLNDPKFEVILSSDKIVVDDWEHSNKEDRILNRIYKKKLITEDNIYAELGEIVSGKKPGREDANEKIFFNPMGMGIEDLACAVEIYKTALKKKIGTILKR